MIELILNILGNVKLEYLEISAIITTAITAICVVFIIATKSKLTKLYALQDADTVDIIHYNITDTNKLNKRITKLIIPATIFAIITLCSIGIYSYFNSQALKYGAYGGGQNAQTLNEIYDCTTLHGFIDQSEELPDDLKGVLIIYVKYGCPDCRKVHDDIVKCLNENNVTNVYFVSTRSEKGQELLAIYPVTEVPSGVYIRAKESNVSAQFTETLYGHTYDSENNEVVFFQEDNLLYLINHQKNGD